MLNKLSIEWRIIGLTSKDHYEHYMTKCFIKGLEHCLTYSEWLYTCLSKKTKKSSHYSRLEFAPHVIIGPLTVFKQNHGPVTTKIHRAWNSPQSLSRSSHGGGFFLTERPLRERGLVKGEGLWLPSRVMEGMTKIPKLTHANGCGSPLTALLEVSRLFWTPF